LTIYRRPQVPNRLSASCQLPRKGQIRKIDPIFEILRALDVPKYMDDELKLLCDDNSFLDVIMHFY